MTRPERRVRRAARRQLPQPEPLPPEAVSSITGVPIVLYVPPRCHYCGEIDEVRNYGTHKTPRWIDRYHQCRHCGSKFISREPLPTTFRGTES